jgi:hypothetical protein
MMRCAPWATALVLFSIVSAGPAQAGRGHTNVAFVATVGHPAFFNPSFHPFFFHPFFRPTFFVAAPVFAPPPVAFYPPPPVVAYYPPPLSAPYATSPPPTARSEDCRQYETTVTIDGTPQRLVGTVCKGPDGNWHPAP